METVERPDMVTVENIPSGWSWWVFDQLSCKGADALLTEPHVSSTV